MRSKPRGRLLLHLPEEFEQVPDVRARLVEVERIVPALDAALRCASAATRSTRPTRSTSQSRSSPLQLDLDVRQAVVVDPLGQRFGQAVAEALRRRRPRSSGSTPPTEWNSGMRGLRLLQDVAVEVLALELGAEVVRQVVRHEVRAVGVIAVQAVDLAEGVVQGGVEGAGGDQRAELRDRLGELQRCAIPPRPPCR